MTPDIYPAMYWPDMKAYYMRGIYMNMKKTPAVPAGRRRFLIACGIYAVTCLVLYMVKQHLSDRYLQTAFIQISVIPPACLLLQQMRKAVCAEKTVLPPALIKGLILVLYGILVILLCVAFPDLSELPLTLYNCLVWVCVGALIAIQLISLLRHRDILDISGSEIVIILYASILSGTLIWLAVSPVSPITAL